MIFFWGKLPFRCHVRYVSFEGGYIHMMVINLSTATVENQPKDLPGQFEFLGIRNMGGGLRLFFLGGRWETPGFDEGMLMLYDFNTHVLNLYGDS